MKDPKRDPNLENYLYQEIILRKTKKGRFFGVKVSPKFIRPGGPNPQNIKP